MKRLIHSSIGWLATVLAVADAGFESAARPPFPAQALGYPSRAPDLDVLPGFRSPPPGYGEVPFWWWTGDPLDKDRLLWQIEELHRKGIAGVQVNYAHEDTEGFPTYAVEPAIFSDAWWNVWKFVAGECGKRNMGVGLSGYTLDWPNGRSLVSRTIYSEPAIVGRELRVASKIRVQGGKVMGLDVPPDTIGVRAYRVNEGTLEPRAIDLPKASGLGRREWNPPEGEWEIWVFTSVPKPGALNPMHPLAGRRVVEKFFQPFQDHAPGQSAQGLNYFFHDELTFGVGDRIWTEDFAEQFRARKGYDVFDALPALFADVGAPTPKARLDYMDVRMQLIQERYFIPIFQWHGSRGLIYGCDQSSRGREPTEFGDYFSAVRWYTAPGHDTPGGHADLIKGKVSSSIAHLYGRPRVWLEGYHSLGWGAAPERLMQATCENYVYGCNLLNLHGLYYTTHGSYWEWAPPCYHFRMPYWEHMGTFLKYFERLSYLLSQGVHQSDLAVLYPVSPGQAGLGGNEATSTAFETATRLFEGGRDFIFVDDESLGRARIEGGRFHVADASYRVLILPAMRAVRWATLRKAQAFHQAGGMVLAVGALPEASDRAGRDDPELDALVRDVFGASAAEVKAGVRPSVRANTAGGVGAVLLDVDSPSPWRTYDGGFRGRWAWAKEPAREVYLKAVWKGPPGSYRVKFMCDNSGDLFVSGKRICAGVDYSRGWTGELEFKAGDVITIDARDEDREPARHTAGLFLALAAGSQTVLSTDDLRYTLSRPAGEAWRTDLDCEGLALPDPSNIHEAHRGGARDGIWAALENAVAAIPRDVVSDQPVKSVHRRIGPRDVYMVLGAAQGSACTFRAQGRVELWDPWTGETRPIHAASQTTEGTRVRMPLNAEEAQLIVFSPGRTEAAVMATDLDDITSVDVKGSAATVVGYASKPGRTSATVDIEGRRAELAGEAAPAATLSLDGDWEFELSPTMDNRWGDFRLPVASGKIGAEARLFRYAEEKTPNPGWESASTDDSRWPRVACGFGPKFWKLGPLPADAEGSTLEARLAGLTQVDPAVPVEVGGVAFAWSPYAFSWRWGREGDPGHQGYHGLKENVTDEFICLGKPGEGLNETLYREEPGGTRYYLWTTAVVAGRTRAKACTGGQKPAAIYLRGSEVTGTASDLVLETGANPLLLRYDAPGRGHVVIQEQNAGAPKTRTPLAMRWYDEPGVVPYDVRPSEASPAGWYRFTAPPGLRGMTISVRGKLEAWVDGRACRVRTEKASRGPGGAAVCRVEWETPVRPMAQVALRISQERGEYGGSALPEPIALDCGVGTRTLGDWSQGSVLENYSGGAWYRRNVTLDAAQTRGRVRVHLGDVVATAEVRVNGVTAGIRVAPPWVVDISKQVQVGVNRLEILVYNTLANHYLTIPTRYRGSMRSGLMGPVQIRMQPETVLGAVKK